MSDQVLRNTLQFIDDVSAPVEVFQSTCSESQHTLCEYSASIKLYTVEFLWTKHPESEKIGTKLKYRKDLGGSDVIFIYFLNSLNTELPSELIGDMKPHRLACEDYAAFGGRSELPKQMNFLNWAVEEMGTNPETGVNENRIQYSFVDLKMTACDGGLCVNGFAAGAPLAIALFGQDSSSATLYKDPKTFEICQVGIRGGVSPVFQKAIAETEAIESKLIIVSKDHLKAPSSFGTLEESILQTFLKIEYLE